MTYPSNFDSLSKPSPSTIRAASVGISPANTVSSIIQSLQFAEYRLGLTATATTFTADSSTDTLTATAHGLTNADVLALSTSSALPGGLAIDTPYYVVGATTNTFQLAASRGGSAIDITSAGSGTQSFSVLFSEGKVYLSSTGTVGQWSNAVSLSNGSLVLPQSTSIAPTAEGSIGWDTDDDLLKVGTGAATKTMVDTNSTQTLSGKTLTTPTIASFANASHTHADSAGGGQLNGANAITDGTITPAELTSGTGSSWTWQTWSPTWVNLTVGNGTLTSVYIQTGKSVACFVKLVFGSTTSVTGADPTFTLPITAINNYIPFHPIGNGGASTSTTGGGSKPLTVCIRSTTTGGFNAIDASTSYGDLAAVSSTVPFTWATGYVFTLNFFYQAA